MCSLLRVCLYLILIDSIMAMKSLKLSLIEPSCYQDLSFFDFFWKMVSIWPFMYFTNIWNGFMGVNINNFCKSNKSRSKQYITTRTITITKNTLQQNRTRFRACKMTDNSRNSSNCGHCLLTS